MATVLHPVFAARGDDVHAAPYRVVMETTLAIDALMLSLSLLKMNRKALPDEEQEERGVGKIPVGLRRDTDIALDVRDSLEQRMRDVRAANPLMEPAAVFEALGLEPAKVLARQGRGEVGWGSSGLVLDGAIRVLAAQRAGMVDVPVHLIAPVHPDTPPSFLFVHFNWTNGARLSCSERDAVFRIEAHRHRQVHPEDRDADAWSEWAAVRSSVPAPIILKAVKNVYKELTPEQRKQLDADLRAASKQPEGVSRAVHQLAEKYQVSRTAIQNRAIELGLWKTASSRKRGAAGGTGGTALDINADHVDKFDTRRNAIEISAQIKDAELGKIVAALSKWAKHEAPEYRVEQGKLVYDKLHRLCTGIVDFGLACEIYSRDDHYADEYYERFKKGFRMCEARRQVKRAKAVRRKAAGVRSRR